MTYWMKVMRLMNDFFFFFEKKFWNDIFKVIIFSKKYFGFISFLIL